MGLDTLTFSFLFLPAVLLCFYLGPARWRNGVLVAASLFFYLCNAPEWLPMMLVSLLLDYLVCAKLVRSTVQMRGRRLVFWLSIIKNLLLMVLSLAMVELFALPLPLGVMVYTTTSMGYVIDVYNGDEYFDGKLVDFLMVTTFFGKLPAGPVVQYSDLKKQWQQREIGMDTLKQGMRLYIGGFAKLVILAQGNLAVKQSIEQMENASGTVLSVWILIITTTFGLYYTLTGYCDMARGLGCFFGLRFPENFHYPFQSRTVSDFFNRFNITVTQFINRYVYVFLGGDSNGVLSTIVNTLLIVGDDSILPVLPFLAAHYSEIRFLDPAQMTQQQLEQFDCTGYQRILISYSVDSFIHGSSAQKLRFLQTAQSSELVEVSPAQQEER